MCSADIFLGVLALLFPPLPVWVKRGICSADSIINILLCCLGVIPGLFHAWYIIAKYPEPPYEYESVHQESNGRVTYVYVQTPHGEHCRPSAPHGGMNYGTQGNNQSGTAGAAASGEGASHGTPPSYAEVVAGDNKVQTQN